MTLLDRFRAQPRQKHPDPAVRLGFVQEIPISERDLLAEIAREDADVRVRRAAVGKLMDPAALAGFATDSEPSVREQAAAMLRDIALEAFEGVTETDSLAAVEALSDVKALALVAKSAVSEAVAGRALDRISDPHVAGSIARHAEHESVRRRAFDRLRDPGEILSVALNCEFREPASTAVERVSDRAELEQVAARARNKGASKRARAIVREIEERETREREDRQREEQERRQQAALDAQQLAHTASMSEAEAVQTANPTPHVPAPEAVAAEGAAREADAERRLQHEERERQAREAAEREADRHRARQNELAEEAARIAAMEDFGAARRQFTVIRREWFDVTSRTTPSESDAARFGAIEAAFTARESSARETDQKTRKDALQRLQQLVARAEPLAAREDLVLKVGERALRDVRTALGSLPPLPSKADHDEIVQRLKVVQSALTPRVQELREVAGWQRWANIGIQEQLVEKMEALKTVEDPELVARQVKDLQQQWRQSADVPRAQGEVLWRRFKAAHDEIWTRCEAHFAAQAVEREGNYAKKVALCERAEQLADSTNWIQTADAIKALQAEWKAIGPVSRGQEKAIWERFRSACDRFFTRRHADLAERKAVWSLNLAKKEALITKVEALVDSTDWDVTANEIKRIQAEWKTIGPVKKSRSEALWQRFRGACDKFFERYTQRHDIARAERVAAREAIVTELESFTADDAAQDPPADFLTRIRTLRVRWQQELAARGVDRERAAVLDDRYASAFGRALARWPQALTGSEFDPESNRRRMESIVKRIEELATSIAGPAGAPDASVSSMSPTTRLAAMLKDALAANTIGGKPTDNESRYRAAEEEVRQAQANWSRIGPVADEIRRPLVDRFQAAIRRIHNQIGPTRGRDTRPDNRGPNFDRPRGPRAEGRSEGRTESTAPEGQRDRQEVGS
jgi:hypothetical protein